MQHLPRFFFVQTNNKMKGKGRMGMISNKKPTGRASSVQSGLAWGLVMGLSISLCAVALTGRLILSGVIQWEHVGYVIMCILLCGSFLSASISCARIKRQFLVVCALSGVLYFGILLAITALFFGGQYEAVGATAAMVFAGSSCSAIMRFRDKGGRKGQGRARHNR